MLPINSFIKNSIRLKILNGYIVLTCDDPKYFQCLGQLGSPLTAEFIMKIGLRVLSTIDKVAAIILKEEKEPTPPKKWITLTEAAKMMRPPVSVSTVRRLADEGAIEAKRTSRGHRRVEESSLRKYMKKELI